ncbi:MAG: lysophospholipid acyltransferase family protein [Tannerellaceae bacterium]|nr:lysophospholipid acyltransferase family protein [Tannerellaceae bacterium]
MGNKILHAFLFVWVKLHALLPLSVLYILSDILYFFIYKVGKYRLKVVRTNLTESFPDKSTEELRKIEKEFYQHFCDYIIETIKLAHISFEEVKKRALLKNPEIIEQVIDEGHSTIFMLMGHYGNWEWFSHATGLFPETKIYQIYRPLNNKAFDKLFIYLRTRFGSVGIKKHETVRDILKLKRDKKRAGVIFLQDQAPGGEESYWTHFLNHETAFFTGSERIARKQNIPVLFLDVQKEKRGYYNVEMIVMTRTPQDTPEYQITEEYSRRLENMIMRNPAYWLWTHKRWKNKREQK